MRNRAFTLWQSIAVLVGLAILTAVLAPVFTDQRPEGRRSSCQSNLKQIGLGIKQYIQDFDEKFPIVNSGARGWKDITMPYLKSEVIFQCQPEISGVVEGTTDYFYNTRLSGVSEASMNFIANTLMNGDGASNSPNNASVGQLPKSWTGSENAPALRHKGGANYSFADGHVKWLKPDTITTAAATSSTNSFSR